MADKIKTESFPDDPFPGYGPGRVSCRWLSERDAKVASSAEIIRLIVDEQRGHCDAWANDVYQSHFLRDIQAFIGSSNAVLVTDAGSIKAYIPPLSATVESLCSGLTALEAVLSRIELGQMELLLGVDGCIQGKTTHFQTVVHVRRQPEVSLANTTVKLYPTNTEHASLVGWQLCCAEGRVPEELVMTRRIRTSVGTVLVLVCNDAAIFGARSRSNLRDTLGLLIRDHFLQQGRAEPQLAYVLIATHWQGINPETGRWSGEPFRQAAEFLANETGATVVTTMRTPYEEAATAADRFQVLGPRWEKVATLLVSDAL